MKKDSKKIKKLIEAIKMLSEQKGISEGEIKEFLIEIFTKAFEKSNEIKQKDLETGEISKKEINQANIIVDLDLEKGNIELKRRWIVIEKEKIEDENLNTHISSDFHKVLDKKLKPGDFYEEEIDISNLDPQRLSYIKQLFVQKTSEAEKLVLYNKFIDKKGEILNARVSKITDRYVILDYNNVSIFLPKSEYPNNEKFKIGEKKTIYILDVKKSSKDAQVLASLNNPNFVKKIIEREIDDVSDGIVEIVNVVREPGYKTKISVKTNQPEIDPVGSIIGIKGQRIKNIINILNGEKVDVIKYSDNFDEYISNALIPGKILGLNVVEINIKNNNDDIIINEDENNNFDNDINEDKKNEPYDKAVTIIVDNENFLPSIGKRGINVKLASKLVNAKIDVKKIDDAKEEKIEWKKLEINKGRRFNNKFNNDFTSESMIDDLNIDFDDIFNTNQDDEFNEKDYLLNDNNKISK